MMERCWPTSCGRVSGLACFLIPILLLAWSFRLMLHRPIRSAWARLALLPAVLTLGAVALSILDLGALSPPAGPGGAIGWIMERLLVRSGLGTAAFPISMAAAAVAGLLLLATMGLSLRDWRAIGAGAGRGAVRLAELSGSSSAEANSFLARVWRRRQKSRLARTRNPIAAPMLPRCAARRSSLRCPAGANPGSAKRKAERGTEAG